MIAAESLVRNGYADYSKLETKTIDIEQSRGQTDESGKMVSRAKLLVTLTKSKDFDANMAKFNSIREENEQMLETEKTSKPAKEQK